MSRLPSAIARQVREAAESGGQTVQLGRVQANDLTVELFESGIVLHSDEVELGQSMRAYHRDTGIARGDTVVVVRKATGGEIHWVIIDALADVEPAAGGGGGGGGPTGPAGGVLAGTYPDPGFAQDMATQTELNTHKASADHDGRYYTEAEVNTALAAKQNAATSVNDGDAAGGVLSGAYPNPGFAVDMATQAELDAHIAAPDPHPGYVLDADLALYVPKSLIDAKGDLFVGTANDALTRLGVGADGQVLTADATQASGIKWTGIAATPPPPVVAALPGSPVDGQEVYYLADATLGVLWHLKYRSASASAYKWEFVGGSELSAVQSNDNVSVTALSWTLDATGPQIAIPLAGDYRIRWGGRTDFPTGIQIMMTLASATPTYAANDQHTLNQRQAPDWSDVDRSATFTGLTVAIMKTYHMVSSAATARWFARWAEARPIRVG